MIGFVRGKVSHLTAEYCLVDVQGVGYRAFISDATRTRLAVGREAQLFTYLNVREDALLLYGFYTQEEYALFLQLIAVSGIGPKVALGMLSAIAADKLCGAIREKQVGVLTKLPGIGKKTAERLILELHDKMKPGAAEAAEITGEEESFPAGDAAAEAAAALAALGYTQAEIAPVLKKTPPQLQRAEDVIKYALRAFAGR